MLYKEDPRVQQWIRRSAGLAPLPADQVQDAWLEVMDATPAVPRAEDFNDYLVLLTGLTMMLYSLCRCGTITAPWAHGQTTISRDSTTD